ncbi:hypothetical protein [Xanthocytophaga agilis]|uniref:Uncharacterized protein n=1 Tax=Xanthocytophaga agilis TaxID=3048010 RepID=A0AAE3R5K9_9BACT|nr:hypothetical protein [Xanthocytophaga agilis]MDJ1501819.1 hypothetical protein [Xanthocytophaga agilis]
MALNYSALKKKMLRFIEKKGNKATVDQILYECFLEEELNDFQWRALLYHSKEYIIKSEEKGETKVSINFNSSGIETILDKPVNLKVFTKAELTEIVNTSYEQKYDYLSDDIRSRLSRYPQFRRREVLKDWLINLESKIDLRSEYRSAEEALGFLHFMNSLPTKNPVLIYTANTDLFNDNFNSAEKKLSIILKQKFHPFIQWEIYNELLTNHEELQTLTTENKLEGQQERTVYFTDSGIEKIYDTLSSYIDKSQCEDLIAVLKGGKTRQKINFKGKANQLAYIFFQLFQDAVHITSSKEATADWIVNSFLADNNTFSKKTILDVLQGQTTPAKNKKILIKKIVVL